jgi:tRNA A-37 threonylcarbamoyl transferase component Bud32/tetratricopeptide (TPR) repeat protein
VSAAPPDNGVPPDSDPALELERRACSLFEAVVDLDTDARELAIAAACVGAPALESRVRALLALDAADSSLDSSAQAEVGALIRTALPGLDDDPSMIGPYRVLRRLGEGGMGRVYLARRTDSPVAKDVAIKLIRSDRAGQGLLQRFEAERRHLAALDHPGISRFLDAASLPDGRPYVVMEAVEGELLLDYCARRKLDLRARLELLRKLVAAVAHAHDRLLVHRDIKPQNVLVTAEGEPKLLDFGIAKSLEADPDHHTRTADRFFTPNASAPEQLLGQAVGVGCDVYALGTLAYELLSGRAPFDFAGLRAAEIERLILQVAPPPMSERAPAPLKSTLQGDLDAIVATCLRKSPAERYANVGALDADLQRYLEGRPVTARAPTWVYRARLFVKRHRVAAALTAALATAILVSASALALQALELREQRNLAIVERDRALKVVEILESAFRNADPARANGDKVSARDILDAAVPDINAIEHSQPELFARMAATLARVEGDLGQGVNASHWVIRGLDAADSIIAPPEVISSLLFTGALISARSGDAVTAETYLERLKTMGLESDPWYILARARAMITRALSSDAANYLAAELASSPHRYADPTVQVNNELRWLVASGLTSSRRREECARFLDGVIAWQTRVLEPDHPWVLRTRMFVLSNQSQMGATDKVAAEQLELVELLSEKYGEKSVIATTLRMGYARTLGRLEKFDESIEVWRQVYPSMIESRGREHGEVLRGGLDFGWALLKSTTRTNIEEARTVLLPIYRTTEARFGPLAPINLHAQSLLASALIKLELNFEALELLSDSKYEDSNKTRQLASVRAQVATIDSLLSTGICSSKASSATPSHCEALMRRLTKLKERLSAPAS